MTKKQAEYGTAKDTEHPDPDRVKLEALALRYVLTLPLDARAAAAEKLDAAALVLVGLCRALARTMDTEPGLALADLAAMLERPNLKAEAALVAEACPDVLNPTKGIDPDTLQAAYARALEDTQKAGELRRMESVERLLAIAKTAPTARERRAAMLDAVHELSRAERDTDGTLAEAWDAYLDRLQGERVGPGDAVTLDAKRGPWADWINRNLGPRAGLEPGQTFILGGAPEAGKTSLAALFAVDALAAGCPVLFWQRELGLEETLEHLMAQSMEAAEPGEAHHKTPFWKRARRPLPPAWADLLTVPRWPGADAESIEAGLLAHARKAERARRAGGLRHAVNGLVLVDYMQLLTMAAKGPKDAGHEILSTAASRLAKAAAESGACLLLLSQLNKQDQKDGVPAGTALAGADLARMAHRVALLQKADAEGNPCKAGGEVDYRDGLGEARLLTWTKARGTYREPPDYRAPGKNRVLWYEGKSRALHGGDETGRRENSKRDWVE